MRVGISAAEIPPGEHVTPLPALPPRVGEGTGGGFHGVGRYPGTLQHVAAELNAEGNYHYSITSCSIGPEGRTKIAQRFIAG